MSYFDEEEDLHELGICSDDCRFCEMEDSVEDFGDEEEDEDMA